MFTSKTIVFIVTKEGKKILASRSAFGLTAESLSMLAAETRLSLHKYFNNRLNKNSFDVDGSTLMVLSTLGEEEEKEYAFTIHEDNVAYVLRRGNTKITIKKEEVKVKEVKVEEVKVNVQQNKSEEEVAMTTVQTELFDVTVGQVVSEVVIPSLIAASPEVTKAEEVAGKVIEQMKVDGVNIKDQAQVTAYVLANREQISSMAKEEVKVAAVARPELAGPMHDAFVKLVAAGKVFTDIGFEIAMNTFAEKSDDHYAFVDLTYITFEEELSDIADYFCEYMGVASTLSSHARMAVHVTADLSRTAGDLLEAGVTKTIQAVNKYVFQLLAKGIEAPIGGRPEAFGKMNIVNTAAISVWDRVKPVKEEEEVTPEVKA